MTAKLLLLVLAPALGDAQFEVASVKRNDSGDRTSNFTHSHGTLTARNVVLKLLINYAYGVDGFLISGGPAWVDSERWDVAARASDSTTDDGMKPMLRALLEDRFMLKVRRETVYALTVAPRGLKLAPLKERTCLPAQEDRKPVCGVLMPGATATTRTFDGTGVKMEALMRFLPLVLGRPVIDKTGVTGPFDVLHLEYAPDASADGPSIFTALQEQLGLKLESTRAPVEVLVIDHIEKPSAN
jgi:uncharacterized protein (TIGR03435 family)